jgi:hypothetical protein
VIEERVHHNYAFLLGAAISAIGRSIDFPEATRSLINDQTGGRGSPNGCAFQLGGSSAALRLGITG